MVLFFKSKSDDKVFAVDQKASLTTDVKEKYEWLFDQASFIDSDMVDGYFVGPRKEMISPWSTNAVEIVQNMGIFGVSRIEEFFISQNASPRFDPMLQSVYNKLTQQIFTIDKLPEPINLINDIEAYNRAEGLALNNDEIAYLKNLSVKIGRKLTDSEIFGFSQVNSEHCRHKIFNGIFVIDGVEKKSTLFELIKKTTLANKNRVVSAYKDNCAFVKGPDADLFCPDAIDRPGIFQIKPIKTVLSLKAETHNFPTTVEPFNGAATGSGGEIRDRIAGGKGSFPIAGTAVYMTSYSRLEDQKDWESENPERKWLYQSPSEILIKASNGASDFGNKFGQPLICGSVFTFEHINKIKKYGFDKVIMQAGGIGYAKESDSLKDKPVPGNKIVLMGGDNYRIGMGGGAVSSVATGEYNNAIELNAVQRSNPEMQKRVYNAIRALAESDNNPIISIHDHGAGGHLNCLSELVENTGGLIEMDKLPVGDPTLSAKEIVGNESQERMGMVVDESSINWIRRVAERERAPMYVIGNTTDNMQFTFQNPLTGEKPIDMQLDDMFGNPPKTIMNDTTKEFKFDALVYQSKNLLEYIEKVLQLESVACKDWLTNKVDRSVTGRIAKQQTAGEIQLPLNNLGVVAIDYTGTFGMATSIGHAVAPALINASCGSRLSIAEALTNIIWAPLTFGLKGISLSANWMWPCRNEGEDARLYQAVEAASEMAIALGINIPTGKDSLSMTQKYKDGTIVISPGTVIISAIAEVSDVKKVVSPVLKNVTGSALFYVAMSNSPFSLGGSSFAQILNKIGDTCPDITDVEYFKNVFDSIQELIKNQQIVSGHDVSSGGLITTLLEMTFANLTSGINIDITKFGESDSIKILFSENPAIVIQVEDPEKVTELFEKNGIQFVQLGQVSTDRKLNIISNEDNIQLDINSLRDIWFKTSYLLDEKQSGALALQRFQNYKKQPLIYKFNERFTGSLQHYGLSHKRQANSGVVAAIIREKGINGDREMAYALHLAGFDVKDVHMTDLIEGRETLEDVNLLVYVGGFSNSDVLGSAKGWAGAFLYNPKAKESLENYYKRNDTLSLGVCNGCQLMVELGLITTSQDAKPKMLHNNSHKFESHFLTVDILDNHSVMLKTLAGCKLGIWIAHGEGKFSFPNEELKYHIPLKYSYNEYPANPNGSAFSAAGICSADGRHLAMMPHLERSVFPWNWAHYPYTRNNDEVSPWIEAFVNARKWIENKN